MTDPIKTYLSAIGKKGGKSGTGKAKARSAKLARRAVRTRWSTFFAMTAEDQERQREKWRATAKAAAAKRKAVA